MIDSLQELLLSRYFALEAIFGDRAGDKRKLFDSLADVYCVNGESLDGLYALTENDDVAGIRTYTDYMRTARVINFAETGGISYEISQEVMTALSCKGQALEQVSTVQSDLGISPCLSLVLRVLNTLADGRNVFLSGVAAFALCEGIVARKDVSRGVKIALRGARWNDVDSLLVMLKYEPVGREKYLAMLLAVVKNGVLDGLCDGVFLRYGQSKRNSAETELIAEYLAIHTSDRDRNCENFDAKIEKIVFSDKLSYEDKRRIVLSDTKELAASVYDLPIGGVAVCPTPVKSIADCLNFKDRQAEARKVEIYLKGQAKEGAMPLLIKSDDPFVRSEYVKAITAAYEDGCVETVVSKLLTQSDTFPGKGNFAIVSLAAREGGRVLILDDVQELDETCIKDVSKLLKRGKHGEYRMYEPPVTLSLSALGLVLVGSSDVSTELSELCRVIDVDELSATEMNVMVTECIKSSIKLYECKKLVFTGDAIDALCGLASSECASAIDAICCKHAYCDKSETATLCDVKDAYDLGVSELGFRLKGGKL